MFSFTRFLPHAPCTTDISLHLLVSGEAALFECPADDIMQQQLLRTERASLFYIPHIVPTTTHIIIAAAITRLLPHAPCTATVSLHLPISGEAALFERPADDIMQQHQLFIQGPVIDWL